ncbi:hypothetical protein [Nocardioides sp. GXQ0305]|uniref:hypothetical protein n=1 Tax=Nocardioides sp. GXQ0305 TaxID=3423912 RepID=UPI003D7D1690
MTALLMVVVGLVTASPASAHHPLVSGVAVCDEETGLFDITWSIGNSERDKVMTYTTDRGFSGTVGAGAAPVTHTENDVKHGTYTMRVDASWPNGVTASKTATVKTPGYCEKPDVKVTPAGFDVQPPTCDTDGVGTIPSQPQGVSVTPEPGTYGPGTYDVVFTAQQGFVLDGNPSGTMTVLGATGYQSTNPEAPCYQPPEPETKVEPRSDRRSDCVDVERRTWEVVYEQDETTGDWVRTGIQNDSGWVHVRNLTLKEQVARGCIDVEGKQKKKKAEVSSPAAPAPASTPAPSGTASSVPTAVDAGI